MADSLITLINGGYYTDTSGIAVGDNDQIFRMRTIMQEKEELNTDDGMFYKILDMMPKGSSSQDKYEFVQSDLRAQAATVVGAVTATGTTIVLKAGEANGLVKNSVLHNPDTGEQIYITADPTGGNTLTVSRGFADTAKVAIADGQKLIFMPTQLGEKALANGGNGSYPSVEYNYIEASSDTFTMSERQFNADMLFGVGTVPDEMRQKITEVNRRINNALIYGKRGVETSPSDSGNGQVYTTNGFKSWAKTHELNLEGNNGLLEYSVLNAFLEPMFDNSASSNTKTLIAGPSLFGAINRIAEDKQGHTARFEPVLGATVTQINTRSGGTVDVIRDRGSFSFESGTAGSGLVLDLAHLELVEKVGMPMQWRQNIQAPNSHARTDELWGTFSLKMGQEQTMGSISGAVSDY